MSARRSADVESRGPAHRLRVLMVAAEVEPFARTGGLGDVVGGLARTLATFGCDVVVVTPRYGVTQVPAGTSWWNDTVTVRVGSAGQAPFELGVLELVERDDAGGALRVCFLDHSSLFDRAGIYGDSNGSFGDNDTRFFVMSRGALAVADRIWPSHGGARAPGGPDVVHAHDWHGAPAIISSRTPSAEGGQRSRAKTVFTIHNLSFQGVFGVEALERLGLPRSAFDDGSLAHEGQVNLMRAAISLADCVTTVSPTYAREIRRRGQGHGLDALLRREERKLAGILNGIDDARFDPSTDGTLAARYDVSDPFDGKRACKAGLAAELGLSDDGPIFASVSRLTGQKGIDLLLAVVPALVDGGARVILVGAGDPDLEAALYAIASRFPERVAVRVAFDGALARRVYAGADFVVVPSRFEPCGLTQLYAMRYGAIPIVTAVGGLHDTVEPIAALHGAGTGFVAPAPNVPDLLIACEEALWLYRDVPSHRAAIVRAMSRDSSWRRPARAYLELYESTSR